MDKCPWPEFDEKANRFLTLSYYHPTGDERAFFKENADKVTKLLVESVGKVK